MVSPDMVELAHELARISGNVIRPYFDRLDLEVETKADESPVTVADREGEAVMRELIAKRFPDHGVIGEEYGTEKGEAEFVWTLDPIDGTISFTAGCPLFGTLIGLLREGRPVLGAIHQPVLGQLCLGTDGGTTLDGRPVRVREVSDLSQATLLATDIHNIERYRDRERFEALIDEVHLFRTWGDCYGYLLLAAGRADIMLDPIMHPWDLLPLIPIVRGAGGVISAWDGGDPVESDSCVAAAPTIHEQVIERLNH